MESKQIGPLWQTGRWFNSPGPLQPADLRGRVVLLHAFQMLCPGCVTHGVPQAERVHRTLPPQQVAVVGLHTVFEHHEAMGPVALAAFLHEFGVTHPVGVDLPGEDGPIPRTMRAYGMRGTPTLILLDRAGRIRVHEFGRIDDLRLGRWLGELISEPATTADAVAVAVGTGPTPAGCDAEGCALGER